MNGFSFFAPDRTLFGRGTRSMAADEITKLGRRVVLVRGRSVPWVDDLSHQLIRAGSTVETVLSVGEPDLEAVRQGTASARGLVADCVVSVGGGATIDLGKAISGLCQSDGDPVAYLGLGTAKARRLGNPLPFVAIPTTAGTGAEATRNAVIAVPEMGVKLSLRDPRLVPNLALIDPALTDETPKALTLATGMDAITQLIESYLCNRSTPVTDAICRDTIPVAISALHRLMAQEDSHARDSLSRASYLSGLALANAGLGVVHGLAAVIGGRGGAHGAICGRLLAEALAINREKAAQLGQTISRFNQVDAWLKDGLASEEASGVKGLRRFVDQHGLAPLEALNLSPADVPVVATEAAAASSTQANPVPLTTAEIATIVARSF